MALPDKFLAFNSQPLPDKPEKFTFPFYYTPHPLAMIAVEEIRGYLSSQSDFEHNFGLNENNHGLEIGKMFGVLVVESQDGDLGYLAAFSGKLAGQNDHEKFVPPVFDMLTIDSFFLQEEEILNQMNCKIESLESNPEIALLEAGIASIEESYDKEIDTLKAKITVNKVFRKAQRNGNAHLSTMLFEELNNQLSNESIAEQYHLKYLKKEKKKEIFQIQEQLNALLSEIFEVKNLRKTKSALLQQRLFEQYTFLNSRGELKSLHEIFLNTVDKKPPAGAGECAAPKLLHYAFNHQLKPICMAEFWWGVSPMSDVKLHGNYYPACRGKCEPILSHMLEGIETDPNPMLSQEGSDLDIEVIYEDEAILVINKPPEFLSVPGKNLTDSVYTRIQKSHPQMTGPLIVHRLDMSTSGIMILAKNQVYHKFLQRQFIKRTAKKRYLAVLDGNVDGDRGIIELPLRVDLDDRPRQLVCYEHGKTAKTEWEVVKRVDNRTYIHFYPLSGRTHQLRVHAAHHLGLNAPIVGDDLYGSKGERLHLHAELLEILHPVSKERMKFEVKAAFDI